MSAHVVDSDLYGHLWTTPEMTDWFCDAGRVQGWLEILASLAEAQADVGLIPTEAARAVRVHAHVEELDLAQVAEQTRATGHSTLGLIRELRRVLPEHAREWVYYGATVQDVTDTWTALTFRQVGDVLARDLSRALEAASRLARDHRDTLMCGRTHGQPGLPITFGFKAAGWVDELRRHMARLEQGRPRWEVVQLGGALGTLEFWGADALELLDRFAGRLGLGVPDIPWLTARDRIVEFVTLLGLVTGTLARIGTEVFELQRPEIGEVHEARSPGTVGSITMPHKRNPEISEHLDTLARIVRKDAAVAMEGLVGVHERDGRSWKAEWAVLPEACAMTGAALDLGGRLLEGLDVDADRMAANVATQHGYVLSEPVMRALSARLGKHVAHELVHAATMRGLDEGIDLGDALIRDPLIAAHLDRDDLTSLLDPHNALGAAPVLVDRVLAGP